jgi:hypothetical protein
MAMPGRALTLPAAIAIAIALAACGGLASPELGSGTLAGRLQNATPAAYLYPYGRPELVVRPAADGSYAFSRLPVEIEALVVVDGAPGSWRAALLPVRVDSAAVTSAPDLDAAVLPFAGRVGVVARLAGGSESSTTRFTAVGTDRRDVPIAAVGVATVLDPLPAGTFELLARASGFAPTRTAVRIVSGATTATDVLLPVDPADDAPGCSASGATCRTGSVCDPVNGSCHECLANADCAGSGSGETLCVARVCVAPGPATGRLCEGCLVDSDCSTGVCATDRAPQGVTERVQVCTRACTTAADCPAALDCVSDGTRSVCLAPEGCEEARDEFGTACFHDAACSDDLAHAACQGAQPLLESPVPGYCTGACDPARPGDCALLGGYTCNPASRRCER